MMTTMVSSSGRIIKLNQDEGVGLIQEEGTNRLFKFHYKTVKKNSKRYLTKDEKYAGELFDFDVAMINNDNSGDTDSSEAINVRHRVLRCTVVGCTRWKTFTHQQALEDHILNRHTLKRQKQESKIANPSPVPEIKTKSKKKQRVRPKPVLIKLSKITSPAVTGRFIGKQGDNLKKLERNFDVRLQIVDSRVVSQPVQILIKPNTDISMKIESIKKALELEWQRCVAQQESIERSFYARILAKNTHINITPVIEVTKDSRYRDDTKFRLRRMKREFYFGRKKLRQTESSVRIQERHCGLNREGCRSNTTCAVESRLKSIFNFYRTEKSKKPLKHKSILLDEELYLDDFFVTS